MRLSPRELEKLVLHQAGFLAQKRYARGVALNYPESMALLASQLLEFIREGASVAELMDKGKQILGFGDTMPGVPDMIHEVQVEGTFPDGTKLVTVHEPICREHGDPALALYGSGLSRNPVASSPDNSIESPPGQVQVVSAPRAINEGRGETVVAVTNQGDRPVQVGSHYPFFEVNAKLSFDRNRAFGRRLNIPAGTAVRFEPGETRDVGLVDIAGAGIIWGGNALTNGEASPERREEALQRALDQAFLHVEENGT
jgi:urease subunit gamma/beta